MSFVYTRDLPNPPNDPSVDAPDMQINTNSTDDLIAVDHVSFNASNGGTHVKVSLLNTTSGITPTLPPGIFGAGFETLYSQPAGSAPLGPLGEIFYSRGGGAGIQLTGPGTPTTSAITNAGYTFLAGGIMLQWGLVAIPVTGANAVSFTPNFPNTCFNVSLTLVGNVVNPNAAVIQTFSVTPAGFTAIVPSGATGLFWTAIGK